ncbi:hypothetical protein LAZ67_23000834 [Cordylochernes scorpioides]|uniref:DUF5641 domain-containing protein n=1 Tax=Cordylochernes scorpioides TaxID=51811 RepID=A0ABY6LQ91_9ARAC|nr:hypothetical protein LAZ67_23000834 [Cordylochernes scorpioides]
MVTILENCERVINARPLTYIAEDNDDLVPLTPEMFLREPRAEEEIDLNEFRCNFGKSYGKRKRLLKEFRKRFRSEYLGLLVHNDNRKKQRQLKVGDIVLVEVENRKQINWPMGKITKVFPGTDNVRRLVEVKTKSGFMKRAVQRLFPLEVPSEDVEQGDGELKPAEDEIVREKTSGVESAPYGRVTSIVQQMMELENSCWADTRREAFITLHDGVRLSQIPARLEIKAKGMISSVYVSYGIRCSLCHRQGHKRANCPQKTGMTEDKLLFPERTPVTRPIAWSKLLDSCSQASPAAAPTSAAEIPPPPTATAVAIPPPSDEDERTNVDSSPPYNTQELPLSQDKRNLAQKQMDVLMKNAKASEAIASVQKVGFEREQLLQAITNNGLMDKLLANSNIQQRKAIDTMATALMALTGGTSNTLYKKLSRARNSARHPK